MTIQIKNKEHFLSFGKMFIIRITKELGVALNELGDYINQNPVQSSLEIMRIALEEGKRKNKAPKQLDYTVEQLADIWDDEEDLLERFMELFNQGFEKKSTAAT